MHYTHTRMLQIVVIYKISKFRRKKNLYIRFQSKHYGLLDMCNVISKQQQQHRAHNEIWLKEKKTKTIAFDAYFYKNLQWD